MSIDEALKQLSFYPRKGAIPVREVDQFSINYLLANTIMLGSSRSPRESYCRK